MIRLNISPNAFTIYGKEIKWYAILYITAFEIALYAITRQINARYKHIVDAKHFNDFMYKMLLIMIIGARIGHVLFFDLEYYMSHPTKIINIRDGGLSFHGGFIAIALYSLLYCRRNKIKFFFVTDALCYGGSLSIMLGRIGNFINQELYGIPTSSALGVIFSQIDNIPRHPVQLYESLTEGLLNFLVLRYIHKHKQFGTNTITIAFVIIYATSRFLIDFVKDTQDQRIIGLQPGQLLSIAMVLAAIIVVAASKKHSYNRE